MLKENFSEVYDKFELEFFRRLFSLVKEREGSLTAMEAFSVEIIHHMNGPTISQFADFLGISQSNATYAGLCGHGHGPHGAALPPGGAGAADADAADHVRRADARGKTAINHTGS